MKFRLIFHIALFLLVVLGIATSSGCIRKTNVAKLRVNNAMQDLIALYQWDVERFEEPLDLYDVVNLALARNFELLAQAHERDAQSRLSNAEHLKMLPPLTLDGFWSYRTKPLYVFQKTIFPDDLNPKPAQSPFPITSSIQTTTQADIRETFKFIDFALAFFQAQQEKNKTLILEQEHLRARQKLILDIVEAYWKAIASKNSLEEMKQIIELSQKFQISLRENVANRLIPALEGLDFEARLLDQQVEIEAIRFQYENSKATLAGLMGLMPQTRFELKDVDIDFNEILLDPENLTLLEEEALSFRPELAVKDLEEKIAIEKIRQSIVPMFPETDAFGDYDYDGNPFNVFHYWYSYGVKITWNLFLIAQQWQLMRSAEEQKQLAQFTRIALSLAVMTQVHVAYLNYRDLLHQYKNVRRVYEVRKKLAEVGEKVHLAGQFKGIEVLNFQSIALIEKINAWKAYANLQIAREQLNYAIGRPLAF